jgi:hypothetical protein
MLTFVKNQLSGGKTITHSLRNQSIEDARTFIKLFHEYDILFGVFSQCDEVYIKYPYGNDFHIEVRPIIHEKSHRSTVKVKGRSYIFAHRTKSKYNPRIEGTFFRLLPSKFNIELLEPVKISASRLNVMDEYISTHIRHIRFDSLQCLDCWIKVYLKGDKVVSTDARIVVPVRSDIGLDQPTYSSKLPEQNERIDRTRVEYSPEGDRILIIEQSGLSDFCIRYKL